MKAVVVCGSPRVKGNTQMILETACEVLKENGVDTELVLLHDKFIKPCTACEKCKQLKDRTCSIKDDDFHPVLEKIIEADAFIIGSPVYFGSATSQTTSLLHRAGYVARQNGHFLRGKVGGPVVVARRAGHNFTYAQLLFFFTINGMIVPGSTYWNIAFGRKKGEVTDDEEGMDTIRTFAGNVAYLLDKIKR
jgi:multimeric flavodoxin WrbA